MPTIEQTQVSKLASDWIGRTWSSLLPRGADLRYRQKTAEETLKLVQAAHEDKNLHIKRSDYTSFSTQLENENGIDFMCRHLHESMRGWAWDREHDAPYESLDHGMKVNYAALFLAANIAKNQYDLKEDQSLPEFKKDFDLECLRTHGSWWSEGFNFAGYPDESTNLESFVRWELENAWRTRQTKPINWHDALDWHRTTLCALRAVYENIKSLDEAEDTKVFKNICNRTHELMTKYGLFGKDTKGPDRTYMDGSPLPFNLVSNEMKENLVLIVLSTLSAISDFKAEQRKTLSDSDIVLTLDDSPPPDEKLKSDPDGEITLTLNPGFGFETS